MYYYDYYRNINGGYVLRFLKAFRIAQCTNNIILKLICKVILRRYRFKYGLEISPTTSIGKGLYLGHAFNHYCPLKIANSSLK